MNKRFQLWDFSPSLNRLLLRSPRKSEDELNVDIIFHGVKQLNIPTMLENISIQSEELDDGAYSIFSIESKGTVYTIEAVGYSISNSNTDIFTSPLETL